MPGRSSVRFRGERQLKAGVSSRFAGFPYSLRRASQSDADAIWALIAGVLDEYGIVADRDLTDRDLVDVERSYNQAGGVFLVLMDGNRVIGTVALRPDSDQTCELRRMYLAAEYRGRGLGRMLLDVGLRAAAERGFVEVKLETAAVLKEAINLYRSAGFTVTEGIPAGKNCNLVMVKQLVTAVG
jgi:putative acetyltransferase